MRLEEARAWFTSSGSMSCAFSEGRLNPDGLFVLTCSLKYLDKWKEKREGEGIT